MGTTELRQALEILDKAAAMAPLNRQDHVSIQSAVVLLRQHISGLEARTVDKSQGTEKESDHE